MAHTLTVYGREGCHLCEVMEQQLRAVQERFGFTLRVIDIDDDPALVRRFGRRVPVLVADGNEICEARLDEAGLVRYLSGA
jgi:glutaredoxin